jgi:Dolichyl-phosphate-mannose-protein mannosyltransferase
MEPGGRAAAALWTGSCGLRDILEAWCICSPAPTGYRVDACFRTKDAEAERVPIVWAAGNRMSFPNPNPCFSPPNVHGSRVLVCLLLLVHAGLLAWIDLRNSPSPDEVAHLPAGLSHWRSGTFDLYNVNPPLPRLVASLPLVFLDVKTDWSNLDLGPFARSEFAVGPEFVAVNGTRAFWYFTIARWACIPFSLLGALVCFAWASQLYGPRSGLLALALWVFSPNILGNGAMVTPDVPATALGVAAGYVFWHWLKQPTWTRAVYAAIGLGAAELAKTTWVILFVVWPAVWLIWVVANRPKRSVEQQPKDVRNLPPIVQLGAILVLAIYFLNLGYGFEGSFRPLRRYTFISHVLSGEETKGAVGNRFSKSLLGKVPVPVPANYLHGIDVQRHDFEDGKWCYLAGHQKFRGWWYWYLYAFAVKTPLGTWLLSGFAVLAALRFRGATSRWCDEMVLLGPAIVVLTMVSSETGFSRYLRYALPAAPFFMVWAGQAARIICNRYTSLSVGVVCALTWSVASSLFVYPHSLSYFNEAAGGPLRGPLHLLDANIDWGQDLLFLKRWFDAHPANRPFYLQYFGFVDPEIAGIQFRQMPRLARCARNEKDCTGRRLEPGFYAISVNDLYAYKHFGDEDDSFSYLRDFSPIARAGYSISIYHLTDETIERIPAGFRITADRR